MSEDNVAKEWDFDDYPIETWKNPNAGDDSCRYGAKITNWMLMVGHDATPEKATEKLRANFNLYKQHNSQLPKPGEYVPIKFSSTENIDRYNDLAIDFFKDVLHQNYNNGFYSDGSVLEYMISPNGNEKGQREEIIKKVFDIYGIDISGMFEEPMWKIFKLIISKNVT